MLARHQLPPCLAANQVQCRKYLRPTVPRQRVISSVYVLSLIGLQPAPVTVGGDLGWRTDFSDAYLQGRLLGQGSFGVVYSGVNMRSGQEVAIKVMPKLRNKVSKDRTLQKIVRETNILQRLQPCQGVVRLEGCFEDDASVALVMEYCGGGDLQEYVEVNGALDERALAYVAREVLRVVSSSHDLGFLHGDVKPANFCLAHTLKHPLKPGEPQNADFARIPWLKALDFGCSQRLTSPDRSKKRTGTPAFMAPEIFNRDYGHVVDVWSTGVMLYWLYCLRFPFMSEEKSARASKLEEVKDAVLNRPILYDYEPWTLMSPEGLDFIQGCLERQEGSRLTVSEALCHPWIQAIEHDYENPAGQYGNSSEAA
eukprot:gene14595-20645_t